MRLGVERGKNNGLCCLCKRETEDLEHSFFVCSASAEAGLTTLGWAQSVIPGLTMEQALHLDTGDTHLGKEEELVFTTILGTGFKQIWEARASKKRITRHEARAEMEATISILRRSRFKKEADMIANIIFPV